MTTATLAMLAQPLAAARAALGRALPRVVPWRPLRIGVGVDGGGVRAVGVAADGSVRWAIEAQLDDNEPLGVALAELLAGAPVGRRSWPLRPRVGVAVGPARAQTKRLGGLPAVASAALLEPILAASAGRFFLRNGVPLVVAGVSAPARGEAWAAAIEAPVVEAIARACRAARLPLAAVASSPAVIGLALEGDHHRIDDGELRTAVTTRGGRIVDVRRGIVEPTHAPATVAPRPVPGLATLGANAARFADAYGAAVLPAGEPLAWRPTNRTAAEASANAVAPWRVRAAGAALVVALVAALAAPGLAAHRAARASAAELEAIGPRARQAAGAEHELSRLDAALGEVAAFDAGRRSSVGLLRALTAALPEGSALLTLRTDSAGGTLVALGPRAGAIVSALERAPGVSAPEIVGPVTREAAPSAGAAPANGAPLRELERVTIRLRLSASGAAVAPGSAKP